MGSLKLLFKDLNKFVVRSTPIYHQFTIIFIGPLMPVTWAFCDVGLHDSSVFVSHFFVLSINAQS